MYSIDAGLYWLLPGPRQFVQKITTRISHTRVLIVNLPNVAVPGTTDAILRGIRDAHISSPIPLTIRDGTDIAADVGAHFSGGPMTAAQLASWSGVSKSSVLFNCEGAKAQASCERYIEGYIKATEYSQGNVHVVATIHHGGHDGDGSANNVKLITFDGGLTTDEMDAYVALRMADRPGPGTTRLLRAIISEFAGFDAQFAERIIHLDDAKLLAIRDHLGMLFAEDTDRWRTQDWLSGTTSIVSQVPHVMHDYYSSEYGEDSKRLAAKDRIARRYWRACLKVMTPWLEERRRSIVDYFLPQLRVIAAQDPNCKIPVPMGKDRYRYIEPEEVEFNNIAGLYGSGQLVANTSNEVKALKICRSTKQVRDDIAHLRPPNTMDVVRLIDEMDALISI